MAKMVTMIKYMKQEELIAMVCECKNLCHPVTGKRHHKQADTPRDHVYGRFAFNIKRMDYLDVLLLGEGYVRYETRTPEVIELLRLYGFVEE